MILQRERYALDRMNSFLVSISHSGSRVHYLFRTACNEFNDMLMK